MQFMDTHIHLQDFKQRCATDIIALGQVSGVNKFVCVSAVENDWRLVAAYAENFSQNIIPAFGLHPWYLQNAAAGWEKRLASCLEQYPQALIGESGFDTIKGAEKKLQEEVFEKHAALSKKYGRPLIIHAVKAQPLLENFWRFLPEKFVLHSYNGKPEMIKQAVACGGYISFSASVLNNKNFAAVVRAVPSDRLLLETDGPYQPRLAKTESLPDFMPVLANEIAAARNEEPEKFAVAVYNNSLEFVKTWKPTKEF